MPYVNVGAFVNGRRPASKKALREALASAPARDEHAHHLPNPPRLDKVTFDATSALGEQFSGTPDEIPVGVSLSVVGPDPYTSRKWYATVTRSAAGKVTLK